MTTPTPAQVARAREAATRWVSNLPDHAFRNLPGYECQALSAVIAQALADERRGAIEGCMRALREYREERAANVLEELFLCELTEGALLDAREGQ